MKTRAPIVLTLRVGGTGGNDSALSAATQPTLQPARHATEGTELQKLILTFIQTSTHRQ